MVQARLLNFPATTFAPNKAEPNAINRFLRCQGRLVLYTQSDINKLKDFELESTDDGLAAQGRQPKASN